MFGKKFLGGAALTAAMLAAPAAVYAQTTSSAVRGLVTSETGAPVAGASVTIRHEPSGTVSTTQTTLAGQYFASGLRVGGPFSVTISADGFEDTVVSDLFLSAGNPEPLSVALREAGGEEIVVVGARPKLNINQGAGFAYDAADIANQPATTRDVIRTLVRDPLAQSSGTGNLSVGGVNPRFTSLAIDGSLQQDDFGLSDSTYATTRSPINIDAVEAASLVATDYSVTASGFTGGLVNIVTKSGTNEFDGAAFYYYADQDYVGDSTFGGDRSFNPGIFEEEEYGISIGGPIIKDKLFFFVSYDEFKSASAVDFNSGDETAGFGVDYFNALNDIISDVYGVDLLSRPASANNPVTSERLLAKIDWNITDDHRASFTYQQTDETGTSGVSRTSFESAWFDTPVELTAYTAQLFSDWTPNFSTNLRYNYKEFVKGQICRAGPGVGQVEIRLSEADIAGTALDGLIDDGDGKVDTGDVTVIGGCDRFRHANEFDDSRLQLFGSADYTVGNHVVTFGGEYEQYELFNLFVERSRGNFVFRSVANIENQVADVQYINATSNVAADAAAEWGVDKFVLFLQDAWQVRPDLEVTLGLRYEYYAQDDQPTLDPAVLATYNVDNRENLDGLDLIMPRVSFRYEPFARTTITGGFGLFSGGEPQVWISNAFQSPTVFASADGVAGVTLTDVPQNLLDSVAAGTPGIVDLIAADFEIPADWKASLRVEQEFDVNVMGFNLGEGYRATAQYLYSQVETGFLWRSLTQTQLPAVQDTGVAPDGRPIYADLNALGIRNITELTNFDGGESHVLSFTLAKAYDFGFDFQVGYAYQDVEATTEGTSSRGVSSWRGITDIDRNNPSARTSPFQVEHAFRLNLGYERDFFGLTSRFDVFGRFDSGTPFTYTFDVSDTNTLFGGAGAGEGPFDNNPLYIPTRDDPKVVYSTSFGNVDTFFNYLNARGVPLGQVHEVNSDESTWNQVWDFQFQQELPGVWGIDRFIGDNNFKLVIAIDNVANLLNDEWGTNYSGPGNNQLAIVQADLVSAADVAALGVDAAPALTGDTPRTVCTTQDACLYRYRDFDADPSSFQSDSRSVWRARVGIRYEF